MANMRADRFQAASVILNSTLCLTMLIEFKAKSEQERLGHPEDDSQGGARPAASLHPWIYSHRHFGGYTMSVLMLLVLI